MLRAHVQFLQTLNLMCLLVRFPSFRYPQINVYINKCCNNPQRRERSERANNLELFNFEHHVCYGSCWKCNFLIIHLNLLKKLYITFVLIIEFNTIKIKTKYDIIFIFSQRTQSKQFISGEKRDKKWKKDVKCLRLLYITNRDLNKDVNLYLIRN